MLYFLRRTGYFLPILLGVNIVVFTMFFIVNSPDDMARQFLGDKASTPEQIERWKSARGYDRPLFINTKRSFPAILTDTIFFRKSIAMFWGEFGNTDHTNLPIAHEIRRRLLPSFCLALPIFLFSTAINIFTAMKLADRRNTAADRAGQLFCVIMMSISTLILIIFGQYLAAGLLRIAPASGFEHGSAMPRFLILPIFIGIIATTGAGIRLYRTFFLEQLGQDFVRTARAKGLSENRVLFKHVLRNALLPILTNIPGCLLGLFTGNMLLEKFFNIPGLGGFTIDAIAAQDFATVRAMVFLGAVIYIAGLLLTDLAYSIADPRIRLQ